MAFLPDTNVWISLLKNPGGKLEARVQSQPVSEIFLCSVVKAELWHGAEKYGNRERRRCATTPKSGTTWKFKAGFWGPATSRSRPSPGLTG